MEFSSYSHIENEYKILKTQKVQEILENNDTIELVALEKIHGTNFSFLTNGIDVECCRRSDILKSDENFYNWQNILNKYKSNVIKLFGLVKEKLDIDSNIKIVQIQLYGELFGGYYPNVDKINGNKPIQKGIYYSNSNEFAAFDLKYFIKHHNDLIHSNNVKYLNWDLFEQVLREVLIPIVPVIARGLWNEISQSNPKFESQIYKLHGLSQIPNNYAEGFVIKPVQEIYLKGEQERLIWKFKNPAFSEIVKGNGDISSNTDKNKQSNPLVKKLEEYVCDNRYDNVVAKVIEGTSVDKVIELFYLDVWVDFTDDLVLENIGITEVDKKECEKKLRGFANKFVRTRYLVKK